MLAVEAARGHCYSPLPHEGNLIPKLRGIVEIEKTKRK